MESRVKGYTDLDRHTSDMETMREQGALAQHALISGSELDF